jgi:SNF2 family DNA or RNA helicase
MTLNDRVRRAIKLCDSDDEQWIVWCGLNDEASAVAGAVEGAVNVEGAWSPDAKAQALEAFQDGEIRVLVTKTAIAGLGMNMQNCSHMAFVGLNDSYEAYYQAIRRCWRFGQQRPVKVHVIVSALEASIVENVRRKEAESARMTDQLIRQMSPEMGAKTMEEFSQ